MIGLLSRFFSSSQFCTEPIASLIGPAPCPRTFRRPGTVNADSSNYAPLTYLCHWRIFSLTIYGKSQKEDLTSQDLRKISKLLEELTND